MLATSTQLKILTKQTRKLPPHLVKRGEIYYFRLAIPKDLRHEFPHNEIKRSLKTSSLRAAKLLAAAYEMECLSLFATLRARNISFSTPFDSLKPTNRIGHTSTQGSNAPLLSQFIEAYIAEKKPFWSERTQLGFTSAFKLILTIIGDKRVPQITRADCVSCRDQLLNGRGKSPNTSATTRSPKTVNQYIGLLNSICKLAVDQGILAKNPAERLRLSLPTNLKEQRKAYSPAQIQLIFKNLPDKSSEYPDHYWMPVIALYSGLRREEIAQLHLSNIIELDGIVCFDISGEHLKTVTSARIVPVHPELIKLGFLKYYESIKLLTGGETNETYLFPTLNTDRHGKRGRWFGDWYRKFLRKHVGINDPKLNFHSFRHTFATALKHAEVDASMMAELLGHTMSGETLGRYAKNYPPSMLVKAVSRVNYISQ